MPAGLSTVQDCWVGMFHYVRPTYNGSGKKGLTVDEFDELLIRLRKVGDFVYPEQLARESAWSDKGEQTRPKLLLTFDDGLRDHYQFVAPILEQHGLRGVFFVNSQQYQLNFPLSIHRWHSIRDAVPDAKMDSFFAALLASRGAKERDVNSAVRWDNGALAQLKYEFNYVMTEHEKLALVVDLEDKLSLSPPNVHEIYMSRGELMELVSRGHWVCSHSHSHACLSLLTEAQLYDDLSQSLDFIGSIGGDRRVFAYPFGKPQSYNSVVQQCLVSLGVRVAFSSAPKHHLAAANPLAAPRLDPRDLMIQLAHWEAS
jgi:peptidoglycan/xylan/chitin deacetylase (PgdA/CDA1 family)